MKHGDNHKVWVEVEVPEPAAKEKMVDLQTQNEVRCHACYGTYLLTYRVMRLAL